MSAECLSILHNLTEIDRILESHSHMSGEIGNSERIPPVPPNVRVSFPRLCVRFSVRCERCATAGREVRAYGLPYRRLETTACYTSHRVLKWVLKCVIWNDMNLKRKRVTDMIINDNIYYP